MNDTDEPVLKVERDDATLQLTLNRPHSANALNLELTETLIEAVTQAEDIRLCVIRGSGRHFCAGFDLAELDSLSDGDLLWRFLRIETLLQAVRHAPFATLALGNGQLVGAGADLFAACWRRVAAPDTHFRFPGWNFELALGTRRLTRLIGEDAARDLLIDTKVITADQGLACELVTDVCNPENWPALIDDTSKRSSCLSPVALERMLALTANDSRDEDIAAIVLSAGRPGLKARIVAYRERVNATRNKPKPINPSNKSAGLIE
jgi:enoyl-CoA hydratase/carnithine racemase